jgi:hypothetical protein
LIGLGIVAPELPLRAASLVHLSLRLDIPAPIRREIRAEPWQERPSSVDRCVYRGRDVYFLGKQVGISDGSTRLFDEEGALLCLPTGTIGGEGDGRCPDVAADPLFRQQCARRWTNSDQRGHRSLL